MSQALYRKYRPKDFDQVLGQDNIVNILKNQIKNKSISHAYIFSGGRGTGKTSTAKIFSKAVNCLNPIEGNPCNECPNCLSILEERTTKVNGRAERCITFRMVWEDTRDLKLLEKFLR